MDVARLKATCLALPGAIEDFPFGPDVSVFKVGGKVFGISHLDGRPLTITLKCEPERALDLRETYPAVVPGYHTNKRHWNTVTVNQVPKKLVAELIEDSYDLVVASLTRAQRAELPG